MSLILSALCAPSGEHDVKSPVEAWHGSDEGPCGERLDESFVSTVGEDEEWEDSGGWGQVGGARWEVLGVR